MPLFGHKNKNAAPTGHSGLSNTDPARQHHQNDFATDQTQPQAGARDLDRTAPPNQSGAGYNDPNNFGASGNATSGLGHNTHHATGHTTGHTTGHAGAATAAGSAALREQGMLHEQQAQNLHAQAQELAEAERLEQEAREHRERAVAQGAHPANKNILGHGNHTQNTAGGMGQARGAGPNY